MKKINDFTVRRLEEFLTQLTMDYGNSEKLWWRYVDYSEDYSEFHSDSSVVLQCVILETNEVCTWDRLTQDTISCMFSIAKKGAL